MLLLLISACALITTVDAFGQAVEAYLSNEQATNLTKLRADCRAVNADMNSSHTAMYTSAVNVAPETIVAKGVMRPTPDSFAKSAKDLQPKPFLLSLQSQPQTLEGSVQNAPPSASSAPAPKPKKWGSRSKASIFGGLALLGGGLAMAIANPNTDDYQNSLSNPNRIRYAGIAIMVPGAYLLWNGLRKR